jgi:hypothetical protein
MKSYSLTTAIMNVSLRENHLIDSRTNNPQQLNNWRPSSIPFCMPVLGGVDDEPSKDDATINLMDYIGADCSAEKDNYFAQQQSFDYTNKACRQKLGRAMVVSCAPAGFDLACKGGEKKRLCLRFVCSRGRRYLPQTRMATTTASDESAVKKKRLRTIKRPQKCDDCCPFSFTLFWSQEQNTWFLKKGWGNPNHTGHDQKQRKINVDSEADGAAQQQENDEGSTVSDLDPHGLDEASSSTPQEEEAASENNPNKRLRPYQRDYPYFVELEKLAASNPRVSQLIHQGLVDLLARAQEMAQKHQTVAPN